MIVSDLQQARYWPSSESLGSYGVRFSDGRPSRFFYWDDEASRRLRPDLLTGEEASERPRRLHGPSGTMAESILVARV